SENSAQHHSSDGAKRRSFLPQRGLPTSVRTAGPASSAAPKPQHERTQSALVESSSARLPPASSQPSDASGAQPTRPRPRSLYQTRSTHPTPSAPADVAKPLRSVGLQRSKSLKQPVATGQPPQPPGRHARTRSTNIATGPRKEITKPVSGATAADGGPGVTRTSARLDALKRSASTKTKPEAARNRTTAAGPTESDELPPQARRREAASDDPRKMARPAFSTLQQHFTPKKTTKASTSSFLHPASDVPAQTLPPEISALQTELLQLHLLHSASAQTSKRWELSAQKGLRVKFDEVASLYQAMCEYERLGLEQNNLLALREWNGSNMPSGLVEHIQALSGPLNELPSLLVSGGRYHRLVHDFDQWITHVDEAWALRNGDTIGYSGSLEGLGDDWKEENAVLTRKLASLLRDLIRLPQPAQGSSIASIVTTCKQLLEGLTDEMHVMQAIEHVVVAKEKQWVEDRLRVIAQEIGVQLDTNTEGGEAWRM
ncbi:hypothetical protein P280DRAFT_393707, partial [Massarina eburnea CBS 473.64]